MASAWRLLGRLASFCFIGLALPVLPAVAATYDVFPPNVGKAYWPSATQWQVIPGLVTSANSSTAKARLDFVGNSTYPTAYYTADANYVYFRVRINTNDAPPANWTDALWVLIDKNNDNVPDNAFAWDSKGSVNWTTEHNLELQKPAEASVVTAASTWDKVHMDDRDGDQSNKQAPDFNKISGHTTDGYLRLVGNQDGPNGANTATFVYLAVKWSYLTGDFSGPISSLAPGQTWRVQFGSADNGTDHAYITTDVAGSATVTTTLNTAGAWSGSITPNTSFSVSSSSQTNGYKDSVYFTATLPVEATGSVTFKTNNVVLSTSNLVSGIAYSLTFTNLPRGTNLITVEYAGDGNCLGSTNTLNQTVTNHPPVIGTTNYLRTAGLKLRIFVSELTNLLVDVDGDPVSLVRFNLATTNAVTLATNSTQILYPTNAPNVNDQISYLIRDDQGGTNTGPINVVINPFVTGQSNSLAITNGVAHLTFYGFPGYRYVTQRATNMNQLIWVDIATNSVAQQATNSFTNNVLIISVTDSNQTWPSAYYRLKWQP